MEFINVYVKSGKPPKFSKQRKEENKLSCHEWVDLTRQLWFMYPEDTKRNKGHPAPFPSKLPARLIRLYSYSDETVLDPFVGTGTTIAVAKAMRRKYVGIDKNAEYIEMAREKLKKLLRAELVRWSSKISYKSRIRRVKE